MPLGTTGTKIANLRFDGKTVRVRLNGRTVDSHRRKLGALVGDNVKTGVNCSINCGAIVKPNTVVFPAEHKK